MSQTKNTLKSYCLYLALRPSYFPTGGWGSTSSSCLLLLLGRSWRSLCWGVPPSRVGGKLDSIVLSRIRLPSCTRSWHFSPRRPKACCRGARAWQQCEFRGCSQLTSCYDEPCEASAAMCSRCRWQKSSWFPSPCWKFRCRGALASKLCTRKCQSFLCASSFASFCRRPGRSWLLTSSRLW